MITNLMTRSQDGKILTVGDLVFKIDSEYQIRFYKINKMGSLTVIAKYSSERKALKVLTMLQLQVVQKGINFSFPLDEEV